MLGAASPVEQPLPWAIERERAGQDGILPTLGMKHGGREQVHGCGWERGTVALLMVGEDVECDNYHGVKGIAGARRK